MHLLHVFTLSSLPSTYVHSVIPTIYLCSLCHPYHLHVFTLSSLPSTYVHSVIPTISMRSHHRHYHQHAFTPSSLPSACVHTIVTTICMCSHHHHYHLHWLYICSTYMWLHLTGYMWLHQSNVAPLLSTGGSKSVPLPPPAHVASLPSVSGSKSG